MAQVGIWGKQKASPHNHWDFRLEKNHKLVKISIDHGDLIFSLKFTTQDGRGCLHESKKAGGWNGGWRVSEVNNPAPMTPIRSCSSSRLTST